MAKRNTKRLFLLLELLKIKGGVSSHPDMHSFELLNDQIQESHKESGCRISTKYLYDINKQVRENIERNESSTGIYNEHLTALLHFLELPHFDAFERELEVVLELHEQLAEISAVSIFHSEENRVAKQWRKYIQHTKTEQLEFQPDNYDLEREKAGKIKAACEENNTVFVLLDDQPSETDKKLIKECEELPVIWVGSAEALSECSTTNKTLSNHEFLLFLLLLMDETIPSKATSSAPSRNHVNKLNNSGTLLMGDIKEMKGENIALGDFHQTNNITKSDK